MAESRKSKRKWMYERLDGRSLRKEFTNGVDEFVEFARRHNESINPSQIRCPCFKCDNKRYLGVSTVKVHLYKKGFVNDYYDWVCHGENFPELEPTPNPSFPYRDLVIDALGAYMIDALEEPDGEEPNPQVKFFFEILKAAQEPLFEGSEITTLEIAARITNLKCEYNLAHRCVDRIASIVSDVLPNENKMSKTFYETKKLLKSLQLPHFKIHVCPLGCMLFWKDDVNLEKCKKCSSDRYKKNSRGKSFPRKVLIYFPITARLQRIFATKKLAAEMRWHSENPRTHGTLAHPSDGKAWKEFDEKFPDFAMETRNVRLGLSTDGFSPHGKFGDSYSCWPVIVTPYNLPPWLCMKRQFMFLSLLIPGPKTPKGNLDVYLQPMIEELKELWESGALTYDVSKKQNFTMKAALLWTISDFPAYGCLCGWATAGTYACPYCMEHTKTFRLQHGNKMSWFDSHRKFLPIGHPFRRNRNAFYKNRVEKRSPPLRLSGHEVWERVKDFPKATNLDVSVKKTNCIGWKRQSIFWELPYWKHLLIRHNLDVMHIEKIFFDQLIHTIMGTKGQTSDTIGSRKDLHLYCKRPNLEVDGEGDMPKAPYTLDKNEKKALCEWIKALKFPYGYASNFSRCVDARGEKLIGMKSHDCHVFMERLLPVAFRHLLPRDVWNVVTELSQFFRDLCSSTIEVDDMIRLEKNIPEIICKLEKIFPPSFFNSMEHLPIHLPYEAMVGGPVQYRWMYPFERFLNHLKKKIGNKARIEGSICNAYLLEEVSNFYANYFDSKVDTKSRDVGRNVGTNEVEEDSYLPEIFQGNNVFSTQSDDERYLDDKELKRAHLYVLSNCEILGDYERKFEEDILKMHPNTNPNEIWSKYEEKFPNWFEAQVVGSKMCDDVIHALAMGPSRKVETWKRCCINGFDFQTFEYGKDSTTMNYGVCVKSLDDMEYYGILEEIMKLSYDGNLRCYETLLFKCKWMDSINGVNVHEQYKLVEVNHTKKYPKYDPFVLANQAQQVYFTSYPSLRSDRNQWWAVFKTKARFRVDAPVEEESFFQEEVSGQPSLSTLEDVDEDIEDESIEEYHEDVECGEMEEHVDDMEEESEEEEYFDEEDEEEDDDEEEF